MANGTPAQTDWQSASPTYPNRTWMRTVRQVLDICPGLDGVKPFLDSFRTHLLA